MREDLNPVRALRTLKISCDSGRDDAPPLTALGEFWGFVFATSAGPGKLENVTTKMHMTSADGWASIVKSGLML